MSTPKPHLLELVVPMKNINLATVIIKKKVLIKKSSLISTMSSHNLHQNIDEIWKKILEK